MEPSLYVALGLLVAFTTICVVVLQKFTADECIKVLGVVTGFFGLSFGAFCGYFFNRHEVQTAQRQATEYRAQLASLAKSATDAKATLLETVNSKPANYTVEELKDDKGYKAAVNKLDATKVTGYGMFPSNYPPNNENAQERAPLRKTGDKNNRKPE